MKRLSKLISFKVNPKFLQQYSQGMESSCKDLICSEYVLKDSISKLFALKQISYFQTLASQYLLRENSDEKIRCEICTFLKVNDDFSSSLESDEVFLYLDNLEFEGEFYRKYVSYKEMQFKLILNELEIFSERNLEMILLQLCIPLIDLKTLREI